MLIKFFKGGTNNIKSATNYLLKNESSKIVFGDREITEQIANNISRKYKYTSGVLSFKENENEISQKTQDEILQEFKKTIFNNNEDDYNIFIVKHKDKNRLEYHFLIPNENLKTNKQFIAYFDKRDRRKFIELQNFINEKYKLYSPLSHKRNFNNIEKYKTKTTMNKEKINKKIRELLKKDQLKNRDDIINYLIKNNFQITRKGKDYISVKYKNNKKAWRLKGGVYSESFTSKKDLKLSWLKELEQQKKDFKTYQTKKTPSKFQEKINKEKEKNMEKINELKQQEQQRHKESLENIKQLEQQQKEKINIEWEQQKNKMKDIIEISKNEFSNLNDKQKENIRDIGNLNNYIKKTINNLENINKSLFDFLNPLNILKEFKYSLLLTSQNILKHNKQFELKQLKEEAKKINLIFEKAKNGEISKEFLKEFKKKRIRAISMETIQNQNYNMNIDIDIESVKNEKDYKSKLVDLSFLDKKTEIKKDENKTDENPTLSIKEQMEKAALEREKRWAREREDQNNQEINNYDRSF